ncbi:hypothetical protein AYO49_04535 [Verrucomicrobiaceae bacterium SCGC AG-212-N21]|nr:hypothetical protein AYO49_04535 [Verrucomicrobiaceae bacterium SCGC AG-212-N21]
MWRVYTGHINAALRDSQWSTRERELFQQCTAGVERLRRLKEANARTRGTNEAVNGQLMASEKWMAVEWNVRKCQVVLMEHHERARRDERWHLEQQRLIDALTKGVDALVQLLPE